MFPRNPRVLIDNKALEATEVHAMVVSTKLEHVDMAEVIVGSPLQLPPLMFRIGANLQIKLALGDSIFAGRIVGIAPHTGLRQWLIRAHGPMRLPQPPGGANDVRIASPIKSLALSTFPMLQGEETLGARHLYPRPRGRFRQISSR